LPGGIRVDRDYIKEIQEEICKCEKLSEIGIELYQENKNPDFLHKAIYWSNEANILKKRLRGEYNE
jgi:hypothetical protein